MRRPFVLMIPVFAILFDGCAPAVKTEKTDMPRARNRGSLTVVVKRSSEDVTAAEASRTKQLLSEKFKLASSTQTGCAASAAGCIYICPLFAPCAFLPGYHDPQFEIMAEVSAHKNGRLAFKKVMSEKSVSKANLVNVGNVEFKDKLEELTLHNFAVTLVSQWDKR